MKKKWDADELFVKFKVDISTPPDDDSATDAALGLLVDGLAALPPVHLLLQEAVAVRHQDALASLDQGNLKWEMLLGKMLSGKPALGNVACL